MTVRQTMSRAAQALRDPETLTRLQDREGRSFVRATSRVARTPDRMAKPRDGRYASTTSRGEPRGADRQRVEQSLGRRPLFFTGHVAVNLNAAKRNGVAINAGQ